MTREYLKIAGGTVYDPANGIDGQIRDIWIADGSIVEPPADPDVRPARVIDAAGMVVMPGGVDMHCHIVGPKVNHGRKLSPDHNRDSQPVRRTRLTHSGTMGSVPSTFATGYKYAGMGYTTAFDAAIPPLFARHAHQELEDTPCIDKGFFALMGNNHYVMRSIQRGEHEKLRAFVGWLLGSAKGFAAKLVNPGGVEVWKQRQAGNVKDLDTPVDHFGITPRQIIRSMAQVVDELRLPHSVHIHTNNLGLPGNWNTTLETMRLLEGHRGHLTHIQFHSYGGGDQDEETFCSKVEPLAEYVNAHPNITVDVGQVVFGRTTSMTADGPAGYYLSRLYKSKWFSADTEQEEGCGVVPIEYKNTSLIHAWQWAIGLEWYLLVEDPWRIVMTTDHPNGGSFLAYPQIIRLLMDRTFRQDILKTVPAAVRDRSLLKELDREYSLSEIAIITRAGPARILGLKNKGHLGPGADADVTIYTPDSNRETMFELPRHVIKAGRIIVEQGEIREDVQGKTLIVAPDYDREVEPDIRGWFEGSYSIQWRNYPVEEAAIPDREVISCQA
ncbi:MAG: formylmethanofuran dehydrogenase subunit A [Isosphaeraceae bacterium]